MPWLVGKEGFGECVGARALKYDGIYIGFKETEMKKLERVAEKTYGVKPRKHLSKKN